jgi:hypothetical protein|tara:strand:- start:1724 stop:1918 length:195 start_codon:yes stop_codon:yes gene_type:complete
MAKEVKTNGKTLSPWAEVNSIISNAKSLTIKAGGKTYSGAMTISADDHGDVTIDVGGKAPAKKK